MSAMECLRAVEVTKPVGTIRESRRAARPGMGRTLAVLSAALLMLAPSMASAELAKWDQARVTKIAAELSQAADAVYLKVLKLQSPPPGGPWSSFYRFKENVRVIKNSADYLATRLKKGGGHDETYPTFRRMMTLIRDAQENGRRMGIIPDDTLAAIDHAGDLVRQIRPYYEDTSAPEQKSDQSEEEE